jgi:hypothetical protein
MTPSPRRGTSAIEVLFASALLVIALAPILGLLLRSHHVATLDELHLLARREAARAEARLRGLAYRELLDLAVGQTPPPGLDERLAPASQSIELASLPGALGNEGLTRLLEGMRIESHLQELEPGLARLSTLVRWTDPSSLRPRHHVRIAYFEDPEVRSELPGGSR